MSGIEQLADEIVAHGVQQVFGVPGSGVSLSLLDALERRGVPFHLTHFEGAGALMAATVGHLSGRAGVSLSIKGPGLANAVPGIAAASFEAFPLVHLAEAFPPNAPAAQAHKRLEQAGLTATVTKVSRYWSRSGPSFEAMASHACSEEPGPVVLELPPSPIDQGEPLERAVSSEGNTAAALSLLRRASRPVVIAGGLARRLGLGPRLAGLQLPIFTTAAAKGLVDETLPNAAAIFTGVGLELTPERAILAKTDLVIGIGLTAREVLLAKAFGVPYVEVHAVDSPGASAFEPAARVAAHHAGEVLDALGDKSWGLDDLRVVLDGLHARLGEGFLPGAVFQAIERRFERRARVVMDTGYFCTIGEHALRARAADLCLMSAQGRYMGTGLPMAIGAALHDRTTPAIAVLGDGGVAMYLAEVKLAARNCLPLLVILMTDNSFASIRARALRDGLTQRPLIMDGQSWVPVFDALGLPGMRAENLVAVEAALSAWVPSSGPAFLEIPFPPEPYEAMTAGIR